MMSKGKKANRRRQKRHILMALTVLVWGLVLMQAYRRRSFGGLAAKLSVSFELETEPRHVRIEMGGTPFKGGSYVATPLKLTLPMGRTRIKVSREGYVPQVMTVEGIWGGAFRSGRLVLQKDPGKVTGRLKVTSMLKGTVPHVEIDHGFAVGEPPLWVEDLTVGRGHQMQIYPAWPEKTPVISCFFDLAPAAQLDPLEIVLKAPKTGPGDLDLTGCDSRRPKRRSEWNHLPVDLWGGRG